MMTSKITANAPGGLGGGPVGGTGMIFEFPGTPAADLRGTVHQVITDLAEVAQFLPDVTAGDADRVAGILERLSAELAEAAEMARALPDRPPPQAGHTFAATAALVTAARREPDFPDWLATVLRNAARAAGTDLTGGQPGHWGSWLLRRLVNGPPAATGPPNSPPANVAKLGAATGQPPGEEAAAVPDHPS